MAEGAVGLVSGRYRLLRRVGQGGMGVVWHARDELLERAVAIKEVRLPAGVEADPAYRRTLREARAAAALKHPGIVTVHDVVTFDGRPWIVMELVDGRSLAQLIRDDGPLPEHRAAGLGLQVLRALDTAHRNGILHRDVKPANILLDGERVVLTDFGIAAMAGGTVLTATDQLIGSLEFIAPERIAGQEATAAADLWALGVTLYTAVAGKPPFQRPDRSATLAAILIQRPDPLPDAPLLAPIIDRLLRKDPAQRPTTEQAAALLSAASTPPRQPQPTRRRRRHAPPARHPDRRAGHPIDEPDTQPKTRTAPPVLATPAPDRSPMALRGFALLVIAAVVFAAVWASSAPAAGPLATPSQAPSSPASPPPTTTQSRSVTPGFEARENTALGYRIDLPKAFDKSTKPDSWHIRMKHPPDAGGLCFTCINVQVSVTRKEQMPPVTAHQYLVEIEKARQIERSRLNEDSSTANGQGVADFVYHFLEQRQIVSAEIQPGSFERVRAVTGSDHVYEIRVEMFSYGASAQVVTEFWLNHKAQFDAIMASFHVTG